MPRPAVLLPLLALVASPIASQRTTGFEGSSTTARYRVAVDPSARDFGRRRALLASFDVLGACCGVHARILSRGSVDVVVRPHERARFRAAFPNATFVERSRPFREVARQRASLQSLPPDTSYYTVAEMETALASLERKFPKIAKRIDITALTGTSKTHEKRSLFALKISDNVATDEDEPQTLIASQHHARELNTPHITLRAAERILTGYATDATLKAIVDSTEIWIVPMVNPDGVDAVWNVDRYWRKNRRASNGRVHGVDLNRNYPFRWGACGASSRTSSGTYKGPSAGSEPETKTMMALARRQRFEKYLDFHSYGREILDTYSPCTIRAYTGTKLLALLDTYRDRLAKAANYRTRNPSASGEAQEWHWAENGSMSFLVEIGQSFQPAFRDTVAEEVRVWPAILDFLKWQPSFRGSVKSLRNDAPLGASLDARVHGHRYGELARSSSRTGRMHLWVAPGASEVDFAAPAHDSRRVRITAPPIGQTKSLDVHLIPKLPAISLKVPATMRLGTSTNVELSANDPGKSYWIALSLAATPGLPIGPRKVPVRPDGLFWLSATPLPGFYDNQLGTLDATGKATAKFTFPDAPVFVGFRFWFGAVTFESGWPRDVKAISPNASLVLTR